MTMLTRIKQFFFPAEQEKEWSSPHPSDERNQSKENNAAQLILLQQILGMHSKEKLVYPDCSTTEQQWNKLVSRGKELGLDTASPEALRESVKAALGDIALGKTVYPISSSKH